VVLVVNPPRPHCTKVNGTLRYFSSTRLRGSSSARFSKNLLPYLSWPIKVPALVSPAPRQRMPCILRGSARAYQCSMSASVLGQPCLRVVMRAWDACVPPSGGDNPVERLATAARLPETAHFAHPESNPAQIAHSPEEGRHGCVVYSVVAVDVSDVDLTMPSGCRASVTTPVIRKRIKALGDRNMRTSPPHIKSHDDNTNLDTGTSAQGCIETDLSHAQPTNENYEEILDGESNVHGINTTEPSVYAGDYHNRSRQDRPTIRAAARADYHYPDASGVLRNAQSRLDVLCASLSLTYLSV
jgi:hypothetical protein